MTIIIKHNPGSLWRALPTIRQLPHHTVAPYSSPLTPPHPHTSPLEHPALVTKEVTSVTTMGRHLLNHPPPPPVTLQASHGAMHGSCKHRIDRRSEGDIKKELGTVGALEMQEQLGVIRAVERRGGS